MNLPDLFTIKRRFFGLSIGKTALRGIEIDSHHSVSHYAEVLLDEHVMNGRIDDKEGFTKALSEY